MVAAAFSVNIAFSAAPTPLYVIYQQRDHFSTLMITVVYAVYAVGVIVSLFLGGHISDWVGRRRMLVPALAVNVLSAVLFLAFPSLAGLIVARIVSGVSIGLTTGTATVYLAELHLGAGASPAGRRPQIVATAANLGGIGIGPLGAGLLAQFVSSPLAIPYIVFGAVLAVLTVLVAIAPETATTPDPRPAWRPQRVAIPAHARGTFFAATGAAAGVFAVYGVYNSLMPGFLADTMHNTSYAVAGAIAFSAFAAGAVAQIALGRAGVATTLQVSLPVLLAGLALFTAGMWLPSLSAPVVALGIATEHFTARNVMLVFVVLAAAAIAAGTRAVLQHQGDSQS